MLTFQKYELCYKHYLKSCAMAGEKTKVTLDTYFDVVPLYEIEEMIRTRQVGSSRITEEELY